MARETKSVPLKKPFQGANGLVKNIILQEPTAPDFFALGEPRTWVRSAGGMALVENTEAIAAYTERCIIEPDPLLAMKNMGLLDAIAVKEAVCGFFQEGPATPSDKSPITSSSSSESSTPNPAAS